MTTTTPSEAKEATMSDRIATLSAVVSERRKDLAKARLNPGLRSETYGAVARATLALEESIVASVERTLAEAIASEAR
jgi:hypothetical protein